VKIEGLSLLDENEYDEQLYEYKADGYNTVILISHGEYYCLADWRQDPPDNLFAAKNYKWVRLD
jgi:hypothetical protein